MKLTYNIIDKFDYYITIFNAKLLIIMVFREVDADVNKAPSLASTKIL